MGQALYRKYRSRSFDEVIGQEHVTTTLKNALKNGRINHAYLFSGPHGVGKTSVARILAHEVNKLPYENDSIHLDIIEIDAASNRRIDEIRELRERVHIAPTSARYKVYIIDEVHMLTREAFNALLKTLEEPPAHCIFILATTEPHKLPETIISRTQRFNFKPLSRRQSTGHLAKIARREKIDITEGALELLADFGSGSFRDSIGLLDQLSGSGKVNEQRVLRLLGLPPASAVEQLLQAVAAGQTKEVLQILDSLQQQGIDAAALAKQLAKHLRQTIIDGLGADWCTPLLKDLLAVPASPSPDDLLEVSLLEAANAASPSARPVVSTRPEPESQFELAEPKKNSLSQKSAPALITKFTLEDWPAILDSAKRHDGPLYSTLRLATPELEGDTLKLNFRFLLHYKKMLQAKNVDALAGLIESATGAKLRIRSFLVEQTVTAAAAKPSEPAPIESISNIFGGAEVLES